MTAAAAEQEFSATKRGRARWRGPLAQIAATLGLATASVVWSETWFWGRWRADQTVGYALGSVVLYGAVVQVCLFAAHRFRVAAGGPGAWRRVFLLGALYGWLAEGVIATTTVTGLPLSISYTALAWHALFTVLLGWWWIPRLLGGRPLVAVAWLTLVGIGLGTWAAGRQFEDKAHEPVAVFAVFAVVSGLAYVVGLALWWRLRRYREPRWPDTIWALVILGFLATAHLIAAPITALALPLIALAWWSLRRSAPRDDAPADGSPGLDSIAVLEPGPVRRLWLVGVVPIAATVTYGIFAAAPGPVATGYLFYLITVPLGFVLFALALRRRKPRSEPLTGG